MSVRLEFPCVQVKWKEKGCMASVQWLCELPSGKSLGHGKVSGAYTFGVHAMPQHSKTESLASSKVEDSLCRRTMECSSTSSYKHHENCGSDDS